MPTSKPETTAAASRPSGLPYDQIVAAIEALPGLDGLSDSIIKAIGPLVLSSQIILMVIFSPPVRISWLVDGGDGLIAVTQLMRSLATLAFETLLILK